MHDSKTFKVISTEMGGVFYLVRYFNIENGVQLSVTCGKILGEISEELFQNLVANLVSRLKQVTYGQIVLTADIANRDVYKSGQGVEVMVTLIRVAIAIIIMILALMVLVR